MGPMYIETPYITYNVMYYKVNIVYVLYTMLYIMK